jgi:glutamate N-acetyltransferase / amino-acid N-acetyltransferase
LGYSGAELDPDRIDIDLKLRDRAFPLVQCGQRASSLTNGGERKARDLLRRLDEVPLSIHLHEGRARATAWGCDLSYTYVQINAAYRT